MRVAAYFCSAVLTGAFFGAPALVRPAQLMGHGTSADHGIVRLIVPRP